MKRQLGPILAVLALLCAPVLWAQSDSTDSSSSSSSSSSSTSSSNPSTSTSSSNPGTSTDNSGAAATAGTPSGNASPGTAPADAGAGITSPNDPYFSNGAGNPTQNPTQLPDDSQLYPDNSQQSTNGPQSTFAHPEQLPPLSMINDVTRNTGVAVTFNTGSLSDYVWGGKGQPNYWQNIGMGAAGLAFSQIRPTSLIQLGYSAGVSISALSVGPYSSYTNLNQSGNAKILWNFARRWQMRIKDQYLYSDNPFEPFLTYVSDPTPNQPNPTVYFPQAVIEQSVGSVDISYRITAHDSINFSGTESLQNYIRGTTGLWNSYTWGGGAFYQHTFSENFSWGGGYDFYALDFGHGQSRAGVNMLETFVTYKFNHSLSVSGWIGPELTNTKDLIIIGCLPPFGCLVEEHHASQWDVAEGGTMAYQHAGNSVRVQFSHRVTDGGGVLGAVGLYQATLAYARPINRIWGFAAALMYNNSNSISHSRANQYWDSTQGTINFSRKFGESWNGAVYLLFINQSQNFYGTPGTTSTAGLGLTLRYIWGHSLGR